MKLTKIVASIIMTIMLAATLGGCGLLGQGVDKYDTLVDKDEKCNQAWANYEAQLQRRSDLIPQMVAIVKGSAAHEHDTLEAVQKARSEATSIKLSAEDLTDPQKVEQFKQAQQNLSGTINKLMMVQENYPTLQANAQFHDLMVTVEGTQNRILISTQDYNTTVQSFNLELRRVSGRVINPLTGKEFKPRVYFSADANAKENPTINFGK